MPDRDAFSPLDALVIGGGPAGSAVARLLSAWGNAVAVLPGPTSRRPCIAESLPPSCRKPLAALEVLHLVESAGFLPTSGNSAAWADPVLRSQSFGPGDSGFQVDRERFDRLLLDAAREAGARVLAGASARTVQLQVGAAGEPLARVHWTSAASSGTLSARWVLDCSGRSGVIARQGLRRREPGPSTTALLGVWHRSGGWPTVDDSHTLVESYLDGWVWSVPLDRARRYVAAMVDPRLTAMSRSKGLDGMYRMELTKTRHLRQMLEGATMEGRTWACSATRYGATRYGGNGFLLVGDAGCFLDPLSSFGVKKALASGWLAAVVVQTCLGQPAMRDSALELFEEQERTANAGYAERAAQHYQEAAAWHRSPFWTVRAAALNRSAPPLSAYDGLPRDPRVAQAFQRLREAKSLRLRPTAGLRRTRRPTVEGRQVVLREHLATPEIPSGIRLLRNVDLPCLVDIAPRFQRVPDLFEAYGQVRHPVALPDFLSALSTLLALGMLEIQSDT